MLQWMFDLTKKNMRGMYEACPGWGWDDGRKRDELRHDDGRYVVVATERTDRAGFVHLRYEMEGPLAVLYVYEIQVDERERGKQLGRKLMEAVEGLARGLGFPKVMLTVFASNDGARRFYETLGYEKDASSPEDWESVGYLILSKSV